MNKTTKTYRKISEGLRSLRANAGSLILLVALCAIVISIIMNWKGVMYELSRLVRVLRPFIFGIVLAFLINPLVTNIKNILDRFMFKGKREKGLLYMSVALAYAILLGFLTITIVYIVPQISESMKELTKSLGNGYSYIINHSGEIQNKYPFLPIEDVIEILKNVLPANIFGYGTDFAKVVFPYLYNLSTSFISGLIDVIFAVVISCYIVLDKAKIIKGIRRGIFVFLNRKNAPIVWNTFRECNHIFNGFLYGKTIDSLIIGILSMIAMSIIHLPYALLLSVIVGVTNMIPYFGPFVGAVPGVIIYLVIEPKYAIIYVIMILVLQQFDGLYLGPRILGDLTGIKPIWVIFAITVGGAYFGVLGMFLGVPTVATLMHIINVIMEKKVRDRMALEKREEEEKAT